MILFHLLESSRLLLSNNILGKSVLLHNFVTEQSLLISANYS